jgi:guanosine-3',5'-bis(diphosphate) 3'-pyrophosphohydrolase
MAVPRKSKNTEDITFAKFKKSIQKYLNSYQIKKIEKAFDVAKDAHHGQKRKSGENYINHPLSAAAYLADYELDHETIMAAILHDVVEDTEISLENLGKNFGKKVAELVDGVSKLDKINFNSKEEADAANLRKMILAMSNDIRVLLIKLADRRHNLTTIGVLNKHKAKRVARETLEIYAPLALRLGIHNLSKELENLSFQTYYPLRHSILIANIDKARGNRKLLMTKIQSEVTKKLNSESIKSQTRAREKHAYGIYKKMKSKELKFSQIHDIFGVRIITESVDLCYRALGCIHNLYKPIPGRFKDYIAIPKSNGYQSLHTAVLGPHNLPMEFQIRTNDMNNLAQSGIAAHWVYKSKTSISKLSREQQWLNNLLDIQKQAGDPRELLGSIKEDLNPGKVYVFSSKGQIIELPKKSTLIDFAYSIHTELGNKYLKGTVDGEFKPPDTILKNGQRIIIKKSEVSKPDPAWLNFVVSVKARTSIRNYLRNMQDTDAIKLGRKLLKTSLEELQVSINDVPKKTLEFILSELKYNTIDELFKEIGLGNKIPKLIALRMAPSFKKTNSSIAYDIEGSEGLVISYAKCCHPIPGDMIIGYVSQGKGIVVHRSSCKSIKHTKPNEDNIELRWSENVDNNFSASIIIEVENERGVLAQVSSVIAQNNHNIESVNYTDSHDAGHNTMLIVVSVKNTNQVKKLIDKIKKIKNVYKAERKRS